MHQPGLRNTKSAHSGNGVIAVRLTGMNQAGSRVNHCREIEGIALFVGDLAISSHTEKSYSSGHIHGGLTACLQVRTCWHQSPR